MGEIMKLCGGKVAVETTKTKHSKFYYSQSSSSRWSFTINIMGAIILGKKGLHCRYYCVSRQQKCNTIGREW